MCLKKSRSGLGNPVCPPASDLSVVTLESNYQFRPRLLCLPVFVLQALEWQDLERLSTNLSRFSVH